MSIGRKRKKIANGVFEAFVRKVPVEIYCPCCSFNKIIQVDKKKLEEHNYILCPNCCIRIDLE